MVARHFIGLPLGGATVPAASAAASLFRRTVVCGVCVCAVLCESVRRLSQHPCIRGDGTAIELYFRFGVKS